MLILRNIKLNKNIFARPIKKHNMLGFNLSSSNFQSPMSTYMGGKTFLCSGEKVPICTFCGEYMIQLLSLNLNSMPLAGSMFSKGVSRLFICNSPTCCSYQDTESVQATILQGNTAMSALKDGQCSPMLLQEKAISSQALIAAGDEESYPLILTKNSKHTEIVFTPTVTGVDLKFARNGKFYGIDSIVLIDHPQQLTIAEVTMSKRSSRKEPTRARKLTPVRRRAQTISPSSSPVASERKAPGAPRKNTVSSHRGRSVSPPVNVERVSRKEIARQLSFSPPVGRKRNIVRQRSPSSSRSPPRKSVQVSPKRTTGVTKKLGFARGNGRKRSVSPQEQNSMFVSESEFSDAEVNLAEMMEAPTRTSILAPNAKTAPRVRKVVPTSSNNEEKKQTSFVDLVKAAVQAEKAAPAKPTIKSAPDTKKALVEKKTVTPVVNDSEWVEVIDTKRIKHEERKEKKRIAKETWQKYQNMQAEVSVPQKAEAPEKNGVFRTASTPPKVTTK